VRPSCIRCGGGRRSWDRCRLGCDIHIHLGGGEYAGGAALSGGRQLQEDEPCDGGRTYVDGGDIFQPQYDNNQDCTWLLTCSDPSLAPQITFTDFHTEGDWDFVYIYDGEDVSDHIAVTLHGNLGGDVEHDPVFVPATRFARRRWAIIVTKLPGVLGSPAYEIGLPDARRQKEPGSDD
jgi:hypothetical protein